MHPAIPFLFAAFLTPFISRHGRRFLLLGTPLFSWLLLRTFLSDPVHADGLHTSLAGFHLSLVHTDKLALLFAFSFLLFSLIANLFALHDDSICHQVAAYLYAGSALGAVLAADYITLFIFWEIMAIASAVLIWNSSRPGSRGALFRYFLFHLAGGLFFFSGILLKVLGGESLTFGPTVLDAAGWLIFTGFAVNAAVVPLHTWLPDAYPEGTPTSSIYLSCFTTKVAVYAFARAFAGEEILITLGAVTAVYGVLFALMENNMRRLLSYHIICQVGYMLIGIGIGTGLGISAGTAHAAGNILFKGLLFMATGALIHTTGRHRLTDLGGLGRKTPWVFLYFMIGAFAIGGSPFLNGYISKSLLLKAALEQHLTGIELILLLVAVGTFLSIACKLAWFAFIAPPSREAPELKPVPINMHLAMGALSGLCIGIGIFPEFFLRLLPYEVHAHVYAGAHVLHSFQLLVGTAAGFLLIVPFLHLHETLTLDFDWFLRRGAVLFSAVFCQGLKTSQETLQSAITHLREKSARALTRQFRQQFVTPAGNALLWAMTGFLLVGFLIVFRS